MVGRVPAEQRGGWGERVLRHGMQLSRSWCGAGWRESKVMAACGWAIKGAGAGLGQALVGKAR